MYYFGTNLDQKFAVPDFWPKANETNKIPFEKEEITEELQRLRERRLAARARRLQMEGGADAPEMTPHAETPSPLLRSLDNTESEARPSNDAEKAPAKAAATGKGWYKLW